MEPYQKLGALIQPILFNLEHKKRDLKVLGSRFQHKHRMAFMVLLRQFSPLAFTVYSSYARIKNSILIDAGWTVSEAPYTALPSFAEKSIRLGIV